MIKFEELKKLPKAELQKLLAENQNRLKDLRFNLSFGKVKDISAIKKTKKLIAQILTILNQNHDKEK
ncbi:MAG: 50S ribosomal protein L29 [Patescibacteria group bacterium]|jgi:large subunit ribosomal protein L29|nr:50S ribosomal protein L29 [Patescibacteria group bacterium]